MFCPFRSVTGQSMLKCHLEVCLEGNGLEHVSWCDSRCSRRLRPISQRFTLLGLRFLRRRHPDGCCCRRRISFLYLGVDCAGVAIETACLRHFSFWWYSLIHSQVPMNIQMLVTTCYQKSLLFVVLRIFIL